VNMCERTQGMIQEDKRPADLYYDRCAPSLIAFAQRSEARDFAREHGGEVLAFKEAAAAFVK
jgi:NosL